MFFSIYIFQVLATMLLIPVILLTITVKFYLYYSHPAMCTDSQDPWTSWIFTYNLRPCWSDLGSFTPKYSWFDLVITLYFATLLLEFLKYLIFAVKINKQPLEMPVPSFFDNGPLTLVIEWVFIFLVLPFILAKLRTLINSADLRHTVHSQLKDSLPRYNEDGFLLREAWDNTMADGCCGVDGYQDFINLNMAIPSVCQTEVSPSCTKEVSVVSNKAFAIGCVDAVMEHIISSEERRFIALILFIPFEMVCYCFFFAITLTPLHQV